MVAVDLLIITASAVVIRRSYRHLKSALSDYLNRPIY